jgi:hypothetical protein
MSAAEPTATKVAGLASQLADVGTDARHDREQPAAAFAGAENTLGLIADDPIINAQGTVSGSPGCVGRPPLAPLWWLPAMLRCLRLNRQRQLHLSLDNISELMNVGAG